MEVLRCLVALRATGQGGADQTVGEGADFAAEGAVDEGVVGGVAEAAGESGQEVVGAVGVAGGAGGEGVAGGTVGDGAGLALARGQVGEGGGRSALSASRPREDVVGSVVALGASGGVRAVGAAGDAAELAEESAGVDRVPGEDITDGAGSQVGAGHAVGGSAEVALGVVAEEVVVSLIALPAGCKR